MDPTTSFNTGLAVPNVAPGHEKAGRPGDEPKILKSTDEYWELWSGARHWMVDAHSQMQHQSEDQRILDVRPSFPLPRMHALKEEALSFTWFTQTGGDRHGLRSCQERDECVKEKTTRGWSGL